MLFCHLIPIRAAEAKSNEQHAKPIPIPIAKLKHSKAVDFDQEILPILKNNCLACHNKTTAKGKLLLETPQDILKGGDSGPAIVPKKGASSRLLKAASHQLEDTIMPPPGNKAQASDLTPEELALIKLWIDQGAKASANIVRPIEWQPLPDTLNPIYAVAVTPDGQFAACARANQIFIYHLPSQQLVGRLTDEQLLKSGLANKPGVAHRSMVHSLAFNPDGTLLASGAHREIKIWRRPRDVQQLKLTAVARKAVPALAASSDGKWLAIGSDDGRIKLLNVAKGKLAKTLSGHTRAIRSLKFSADNTRLVSAAADNTLRVWGVPSGKLLAQARSEDAINAVTWCNASAQIASGGADKRIHIWRIEPGKPELAPLKEFPGHEGAISALDSLSSTNAQIVSGGEDGTVRIWDANTGQLIREIKHPGPVATLAVRGDGKRLASAGADKLARLWDLNDGKEVASLKGDRYAQEYAADRERLFTFAKREVDYYKAALKSGETNQAVQLERVKKATEASEAAAKVVAEKQKKQMEARETKASAEKAVDQAKAEVKKTAQDLEEADKAAKQAEAEAKAAQEASGEDKETIAKAAAEAVAKSKAAAEARKSADKLAGEAKQKEKEATEKLASANKTLEGAEKELKKAEQTQSTAETELQLAGKASEAAAEAVSRGKEAIQDAEDFQKDTEAELGAARKAAADSEQPVRALAFSPDNQTLATAGEEGRIHLWNAENGAAFETLKGHQGTVTAVAFPNNRTLASVAADRNALVWDLQPEWKLERTIGTGDSNSALVDRVNAVRFSPDGKSLASGGGEPTRDGEINLWQVATGQLIRAYTNVHSDAVFSLDFSPDGKYLASGAADKFVKVLELRTGKVLKQFEGHTHHVLGVSWNRNQRTLASAGADNVVKIWDFVKGEKTKNITGFDKEVTAIGFVGYTDQALAASGDAKVRLVRDDASDVRSFSGATDFIEAAAVSPDGKTVVAGGQDSVLRVWDGTNGKLLVSFPPPEAGP